MDLKKSFSISYAVLPKAQFQKGHLKKVLFYTNTNLSEADKIRVAKQGLRKFAVEIDIYYKLYPRHTLLIHGPEQFKWTQAPNAGGLAWITITLGHIPTANGSVRIVLRGLISFPETISNQKLYRVIVYLEKCSFSY